MRFDAVLFDWMLTLAHYPPPAEHISVAMQSLGRAVDDQTVAELCVALTEAKRLPEVQAAEAVEDTSAQAHRHSEYLLYERAGIDSELADAMYRLLGDPSFHPCYDDAPTVLAALDGNGVKVGVVSDIHVDLRPHADAFGFGRHIDSWALSVEHGIQKPDHALFVAALAPLGVAPDRTLMVGDRPSRDGAAVELGMTCLILPPHRTPAISTGPTAVGGASNVAAPGSRGLDLVLDFFDFV